MTRIIAAAIAVLFLLPSAAQARHHHYRHHHYRHYQNIQTYDSVPTVAYGVSHGERTVIGGRPAGCPHAYCGCGLARYLGLHDIRLNLARNWARLFPHTSPGPGAVAVRTHHVVLVVAHAGGSNYVVRDYNGGRGLSYIHTRNLAGYTFVSPTRMASL